MKKNVELETEVVDPTRKAIADKIEAKRKATGTLDTKARNLDAQIDVYSNAVLNYEEKLRKALERIEAFKVSKIAVEVEAADRQEELDHMDEILTRYDKASVEREKVLVKIRERIDAAPEWFPGMDESLRGGFERDPEYKKAVARREYLDNVLANCLSDVRKIFVSRGTVSEYNVKGRKGV
jgi:SMC interacting uncharacterized protein involved in chromosome segregation